MLNNREKGNIAEQKALIYLEQNGYEILHINYQKRYGEIDIIAKKYDCISFVEVKYRKSLKNGYPREAVSINKQKKIKDTALMYISENNILDVDFSFDVIEIIGGSIEHIKNAFC